jgi:NMD protein affecting ribosome stability and mRNA decay
MFCPKCRREYEKNIGKCAICKEDLKERFPEENSSEFVEVFSTFHQGDISFIKSVLEGEGISYFFQGENSIMLVAAGAYARLLVRADQAQRAAEILRDLGFLKTLP